MEEQHKHAQALVPCIPEDAPFTPAQRTWLNGYLAGLYSYAPANSLAGETPALRVAVLYGSQTGTAEGLARKLSKELKAAGYTVSLNSLEGYIPATLAAERYAFFIVSTYGEGEAPDPVQPFFQQLCVERFPLLWGTVVRHTRARRFALRTLLPVRKESGCKAQRPRRNVDPASRRQ